MKLLKCNDFLVSANQQTYNYKFLSNMLSGLLQHTSWRDFNLWITVNLCDKENIFNYLLNRKTRTFIYLHLYQTRLLTTRTYQALAWCVGDSPCPCCHSCKSRKRRLRWAMKSLLKGKAVWADIACTKF